MATVKNISDELIGSMSRSPDDGYPVVVSAPQPLRVLKWVWFRDYEVEFLVAR